MVDEEGQSVVIDIRKPRRFNQNNEVKTKTRNLVKKTTKRNVSFIKAKCEEKRNLLPSIVAINPVPIATLSKEELLLPYLRYSKMQERNRFKHRLGIGLQEDYKIACTDLRKRLHIDDPKDYCQSITDIDSTFFTCVKGSLLSNYVAPYKSLKHLYNSQMRWRQEVGYRRDCILNIDTNYKKEQQVYEMSVERCKKQMKYLDDFISDDYRKSMLFLSKWEELKITVSKKIYELQCLAAEKFTMTSKILGLDYRYGLQQKYGRFLYYLSPPSWRLKNRNFARSIEIEAKGFDFGSSSEEDTFNVIFEKLKRECDDGLVKPVLYFQQPNDLLQIFDGIEQQQLHHFTHVARLVPHTSFLKKGIRLFKDIISQDSAGVINKIKNFENMLLFCEEQCSQLEAKFFKILHGLFFATVGAPEVLKFQIHLEFCYEKVLNEKPMNLSLMGTAKALENFYMDYSKRMESVTADDIKKALNEFIESKRREFRKAKLAARELCLFERLERDLLSAYAPSGISQNSVVNRSKVKRSLRKKVIPKTSTNENRKLLTESEIEYLLLFTDWTEKEDPALYLRSLSNDEMKLEKSRNS